MRWEEYVSSGVWKCRKSPTGAHHWIGDAIELQCKYCLKTQLVDYRTIRQIENEERRKARKNEGTKQNASKNHQKL